MPLELNGQPFTITDEDTLRKYSREFVFTCSSQYIKINNDPEATHPIETAPVHIPTSYNHHIIDSRGLRISQGLLRYYDAYSENNDNGRAVRSYTPLYVGIGHGGVMKSSDLELNYFLDNSPFNTRVKQDSLHPNFDGKLDSLITTFEELNRANTALDIQRKAARLTTALLDDELYPQNRLAALAKLISFEATQRKIAHRLWDIDRMTDAPLRAEMVRLAAAYPIAIDEISRMQNLDLVTEVANWKELSVVTFNSENEWVFNESRTSQKPIMKVPQGQDAVQALAYFLKVNDPQHKWYRPLAARYKKVSEMLRKKEDEPVAPVQ